MSTLIQRMQKRPLDNPNFLAALDGENSKRPTVPSVLMGIEWGAKCTRTENHL